jgi:hypothetical protein
MSYVSTVVDFINTRSTSPTALSAEDYTTIAEWEKQEIPLGFVLDSLDQRLIDLGPEPGPVSIGDLTPNMGIEFADWLVNQTSHSEGH